MSFTLQVFKHVIQENLAKSKSVVCSPASVDVILRILAAGAKNSTLAQLLKVLGHADVQELNTAATKLAEALKSSNDKGAPQISYVNALWVDQRFSLKAEFEKILKDVHNARASVVDFVNQADKVVKEANAWAEKETKGLIKQVLTSNNINDKTMLLLANALYFKGTWLYTFNPKHTKKRGFNLLDGHKVRVPFMNQREGQFDYGTFKDCQVLRMRYKSGESLDYCYPPIKDFSMYIFLPYEKDGLPNLLGNITIDENMFEDQVKLDYRVEITKLSIPKFKFEFNMSLKETMVQLGLTLPFEENCKDLLGMIDEPQPLYAGDIVQKCCVEANERGTEAAAFTFDLICGQALERPPEINFVADHPFMFMIREDVSGAILFIGTMLDPR